MTSTAISQEIDKLVQARTALVDQIQESEATLESLENATFDGDIETITRLAKEVAESIPAQRIVINSLTAQLSAIDRSIASKESALQEALEQERKDAFRSAFEDLQKQAQKVNSVRDQLAKELAEFEVKKQLCDRSSTGTRFVENSTTFALQGLPNLVIYPEATKIFIGRLGEVEIKRVLGLI
jgi:uncharacterized protein YukE